MKALITGITGQAGSYLAELLLDKNYDVAGLIRRSSQSSTARIDHITNRLKIFPGDLCDQTSIDSIIREWQPDEVYNLAAQSFVPASWDQPIYTSDVTGLGVLRILDAIKKYKPDARFVQSSSSEMFGRVMEIPQKETTPFYPRSPYGVAKIYGYWITVNYRESFNLHLSNSICFNMESPRRGLDFVTKKIANGVARIYLGKDKELRLGNLDSMRDFGYVKDYVEAMWLMLQKVSPGDYVIGSEETHSIREFCDIAFSRVGMDYRNYVVIDPAFFRPAEVNLLLSDCTKAKIELGWHRKTSFIDLVNMMVDYDVKRLST